MVSLARLAREQLEQNGTIAVEAKVVPSAKHRPQKITRNLDSVDSALFIVPHGLGDCVLFTVVINHLRCCYPKIAIDVQCREEFTSIFHGIARRVWTMTDEPKPASGTYGIVDRVPWHIPTNLPVNAPANKPSLYLADTLSIAPCPGMSTYCIAPSSSDALTATKFLKRFSDNGQGRYKVVIIQPGGATLKDRKNLPQDVFLAAIKAASQGGHKVAVLDLEDCPWEVPANCVRIDAKSDLWGSGNPSPGVLAAFLGRVALFVGIDSGPGHLAGATDTPTILAWIKHHPIQHYGLANNVLHLVPKDHAKNVAGTPTGDLGFFERWYDHEKYIDLKKTMQSKISEALSLDRSKRIRATVPQGLGDILWIIRKLRPYYETIDLDIGMVNASNIEERSIDWCKIFPGVVRVRRRALSLSQYDSMFADVQTIASVRAAWFSGVASVVYAVNRPLENGTPLEKIDDGKIEWEMPLKRETAMVPFEKFITLAVSAGTATLQGVWTVDQWIEFVNRLHERYDIGLPIVLLGAEFDRAVVEDVRNKLTTIGYVCHVMLGCSPPQVADVLARTELHLGYQSGLNILADHFDRQQVMMYFTCLPKMRDAWAKPSNRGTKLQCFLFSQTPDEVARAVELQYATQRTGVALLATWGVGDFLAAYSYMTRLERMRVSSIMWASRNRSLLQPLVEMAFPNLTQQTEVFREFSAADTNGFCIRNLRDLQARLADKRKSINTVGVTDLNMEAVGRDVASGERVYQDMGVFAGKLADVSRFDLPANYWVVHPYSENARKGFRDLSPDEWHAAVSYLRRHGRPIVVVNHGKHHPKNSDAIDLTNRLTMLESLEVVRQAAGFIGCASCFSVMASKTIHEDRLFVKGHHDLRHNWWRIYYAPRKLPSFLYDDLRFLNTFVDPDPIFKHCASLADGDPFGDPNDLLELSTEYGIAWQQNRTATVKYGGAYIKEYMDREWPEIGVRINRARCALVEKYCKAVLDVGIGAGTFLKTCLAAKWGSDVNPVAIKLLKRCNRWWDWEQGVPPGADGVSFFDVLEHIPRPTEWMHRIPSGCYAFVTIPIVADLKSIRKSKHHKSGQHLVYFTLAGFRWYAAACGFAITEESGAEVQSGRQDVRTFVLRRTR